jgi:flagellar hook-length control protein FliK
MNPGNLGELMIQVSTNGKDVGLKVKTADSTAKKVIEESLGALRDSLAQQSLSLGRVDVTLASQNPSSLDSGAGRDFAQAESQFGAQAGLQDGSERGSKGETGFDRDSSRTIDAASASRRSNAAHGVRAMAGTMNARGSSTRLDVMA